MSVLPALLRRAGLIALAAALLLWPAVLNGRPAVFTDTALYVSEAEYLTQALGLPAPRHIIVPADDPTRLPDRPGAPNLSMDIDGGRSPVWGGFLYLLQRAGGLWLFAYTQALAAALAVYLLYRAAAPRAVLWSYPVLMAGLAAVSSLPVFATLAMPDLFAGVAAVCLLTVLAYWDRLGLAKRAVTLALLAFAMMAHGSNPLLVGLVAITGAGVLWATGMAWQDAARRAGIALLAALVAVCGVRLAYQPIQARAGEAIGSPPFLSARVLADGPGRLYLRRVCPPASPGLTSPGLTSSSLTSPFALCRFERQPLTVSDEILWSHRPAKGVFSRADAPTRLRMEREDLRFALATLLADPVGEIGVSLRNAGEQLVEMGVGDSFADQRVFVVDGFWRRTSLPRIIPDAQACLPHGRCAPRLPSLALSIDDDGALVAAILFAAWRLSRRDMCSAWPADQRERGSAEDDRRRMIRLVLLVGLVLVSNAVICGVLSGPFDRYQARLAWIAPLAAGLLVLRFGPAVACRRRDTNSAIISAT